MAGMALLVASCSFGDRPPIDWSVRADNDQGTNLLVRFVADGLPSYYLLPHGSDAMVVAGTGRPPDVESVALLDPVSCRPIDQITSLPGAHSTVSAGFGGSIAAVYAYDPSDHGNDWGVSERLEPTSLCADNDASTTPAPAPSMRVGDWLNGWEMACLTRGDDPGFGVRGEFLAGAADGCEAQVGSAGAPIPASGVALWNPDRDMTRLGVAWRDRRCVSGATVSILPEGGRYVVNIVSIGTACSSPTETYSAVFYLTTPVGATDAVGELDVVSDP
jgi:hypothetical protein